MMQIFRRMAMLGAAGAILAACATPEYPISAEAAPLPSSAPQIVVAQQTAAPPAVDEEGYPAPAARPIAAPPRPFQTAPASPPQTIATQPLAPPPAAEAPLRTSEGVSRQPQSARQSQAPAPTMVPDETPPPQPERARTETIVTAGGKVIEMAGPPVRYTVKKGEGLDAIARKLDTDRTTLAKDNKLKPPYLLKPGKVLKGPTTTLKAYVVENGDTVFNVAQRFNVKADALSRANNLRRGAAIKKGQKLVLPSGYKDRGPIRRVVTVSGGPRFTPTGPAAPAYQAPASTPSYSNPSAGPSAYSPPVTTPSAPIPYRPSRPSGSGGAILDAAPPPSDAQIAALGAGRFAWPLKGDIRSLYGPKGGGQRNDGIDIAAPAGSPVRAAADGEVVYAGDQVPGFGNLVLIKHADGWVTAYAHLSRALVSMRQRISQGDQLGLVGTSGGVSEPQLHFEVRYSPSPKEKARAVDPGLVLPK